jgi:hypothetical protein
VESTAPPCEAGPTGLEPPVRPHAARRGERSGRHAHQRSPTSRI